MFEPHTKPLLPRRVYHRRIARNLVLSIIFAPVEHRFRHKLHLADTSQ